MFLSMPPVKYFVHIETWAAAFHPSEYCIAYICLNIMMLGTETSLIDGELHGALCCFLAYFSKMKVDLSNHQSVCLSVCPQLIASELLGRFS
jgi:hypothetical protein